MKYSAYRALHTVIRLTTRRHIKVLHFVFNIAENKVTHTVSLKREESSANVVQYIAPLITILNDSRFGEFLANSVIFYVNAEK